MTVLKSFRTITTARWLGAQKSLWTSHSFLWLRLYYHHHGWRKDGKVYVAVRVFGQILHNSWAAAHFKQILNGFYMTSPIGQSCWSHEEVPETLTCLSTSVIFGVTSKSFFSSETYPDSCHVATPTVIYPSFFWICSVPYAILLPVILESWRSSVKFVEASTHGVIAQSFSTYIEEIIAFLLRARSSHSEVNQAF